MVMTVRMLLSFILLYSSLFSMDIAVSKGWNLVGNGNRKVQITNISGVKRIFAYENNRWKTFPKYKGYQEIEKISPHQGFWLLSDKNQKISFRVLDKPLEKISLLKGWNLISSAGIKVADLLKNKDISLLWTYKNSKWQYATNDAITDGILKDYGYEKIGSDDNANGVWAYATNSTAIMFGSVDNYFYGDSIHNINRGTSKDIIVVSDNYPDNNYGYFLKNGEKIAKDDLAIKGDDNLSFVPNNKVSLHFVNLDNLNIDYMPIDSNFTDSNGSFSIIMPKFGKFSVKVNEDELNGDKIFLDKQGVYNIGVSVIDKNGNFIKNIVVFAEVSDEYKNRFDTLQAYTDSYGVARFKYNLPSIKDEAVNVNFYFYDGFLSKISKNIVLSSSSQVIDTLSNSMIINKPSTKYVIKGMIYNKQSNLPVANTNLNISRVSLKYGIIEDASISSDENGYFNFTYISPENLSDLNETNITISSEFASKTVTLVFNQTATSRVKKIILDPSSYVVDNNSSKDIDIYTFDENNISVSSPISIGSLIVKKDDRYYLLGSIEPSNTTTDKNGKATVTFTPSDNLDILSGGSYLVKISSDENISTDFKIVIPSKESKVSKIILLPNVIKVTDGLTQEIKILTLTSSNKPVSATVNLPYLVDSDDKLFGTFDKYSVKTDAVTGEASVVYTAPADITQFSGEKNISLYTDGENKISFLSIDFEQNKPSVQINKYKIVLSSPNSIEVGDRGDIVVKIVKDDQENIYAQSKDINDVNVTILNQLSFFGDQDGNYSIEYKNIPSKTILLHSKHFSGVEVVKVSANIFNGESNTTISKTFPISISSGPVSAISMIYQNSRYDAPFYEDHYTLHAVDKYGNPAKEGTKIVVGAIAGVKKGGNGHYLMVDKNGTLGLGDGSINEFNLTNSNYSFYTVQGQYNNDEGSDTLIILANEERHSPLYMGGWIIDKVDENNETLYLEGNFVEQKTKTDRLSFVIGNEKRYDECSKSIEVVDFDEPSKTYLLDSKGNANLTVRYDPLFVGREIFLYANSYMTGGKRVGVARDVVLGSRDFINVNDTPYGNAFYTYNNDSTTVYSKVEDITFTLKENALPLKNFYFDNSCFKTEDCTINVVNKDSGCSGTIKANITVKSGDTCKIYWTGKIIQKDY